jgi:hypothetical protein
LVTFDEDEILPLLTFFYPTAGIQTILATQLGPGGGIFPQVFQLGNQTALRTGKQISSSKVSQTLGTFFLLNN